MKKPILIIIILIVAGLLFWVFKSKPNTQTTETTNIPTTQNQVDDTEITTINSDIESIDIGNVNQEFIDIDKDLQDL